MKWIKGEEMPDTGRLGEDIAARYLIEKGFSVITRNYRKKWGEIDIVAAGHGEVHFVEVKSVSCEIQSGSQEEISRITSRYQPEERVHEHKSKRLLRTIETYLAEKKEEGEWTFDVLAVFLDPEHKRAFVRLLENALS